MAEELRDDKAKKFTWQLTRCYCRDELIIWLRKIKNWKATGLYGINAELLKYVGDKLHKELLNIVKNC